MSKLKTLNKGLFMTSKKSIYVILICIYTFNAYSLSNSVWNQTEIRQSGNDWNDFVPPVVTIIDKDQGQTQGSQLVHNLFPDLKSDIKNIAKGVCQILYRDVSEVPYFEELQFELEYRDGVAYKAGNPPKITVNLSTKYLESQYSQKGDNGIIYEINGVNWHELTHAYQYVPQNCGGYQNGTEFFGFIEGTADAVRILSGFHSDRTPSPGGSWTSGYTTTGFFIEWLVNNYDSDFLYKLNQSCKTINPWSYNKACNEILGKNVQDLWDEYQWFLTNGGDEAVALFDSDLTVICKNQSIQFNNRSFNNPTSFDWTFEGGSPSTSSEKNPKVHYASPGKYTVQLKASNSNGSTIKKEVSYITVINRDGKLKIITEPDGDISSEFKSQFSGEDITKLVDKNHKTKFCVKNADLWIRYNSHISEKLCAYSLTSASDASWRDPKEWILYGSNDGINWNILDEKSNINFQKRNETKIFEIENKEIYKSFRLDVKAKNDTLFQLAELVLYSIDGSVAIKENFKSNSIKNMILTSSLNLIIPKDYNLKEIKIFNIKGTQLSNSILKDGVKRLNKIFNLPSGFYIAQLDLENIHDKSSTIKREQFIIK